MNKTRTRLLTIVLALVIGTMGTTAPIVALAQRAVEGKSVQLQLEDLVPSDAGAGKLQRLRQALDELGTATGESLERVRTAREAFEANPTSQTEALLFSANATAIRRLYEAQGSVVQAAGETTEVLDKLATDAAAAEEAFGNDVGKSDKARRRANERIDHIEGQLDELATRFDEIVGPDGQIEDDELEDAVLQAGAALEYANITAQLAEGDLESAKSDLEDLREAATRLRRQRSRLRVIIKQAQSRRAALGMIARSQAQRIQRRGLLRRTVDFLKWSDSLPADFLQDREPMLVMPSPGGSVLDDYEATELTGRSGADILRELREKRRLSAGPTDKVR